MGDCFQDHWTKARDTLVDFKFFRKLPHGSYDCDLLEVVKKSGPDRTFKGHLDTLRDVIKNNRTRGNMSEGEVIMKGCNGAERKRFWAIFTIAKGSKQCATIKMLRHLYMVRSRGGQEVWCYSPPKAYTKWIFDEIGWKGGKALEKKLNEETEVYSESEKTTLADATQMAKAWAMKAVTELTNPNDATKAAIKLWFGKDATDDDKIKEIAKKLLAGFKKISATLNSNKLILSDHAPDRVKVYDKKSGKVGWDDYAFVKPTYFFDLFGEKMDVIYAQGAMLRCGKIGKLWLAALTVIHELSHREVKTDDKRYDTSGDLNPQHGKLSMGAALNNADSWGYFCADINGALPASEKNKVLN